MSMEVDISTPLTAEEYRYLVERSRGDLIERAHSMHGTSDADYAEASAPSQPGPRPQTMLQGEARAARREQLLEELAALSADDETDDGDETDDEEDTRPYTEWTVAELDEQLKFRQLPTSGSKADKIARLEADDAAA